MAVNVWQGVQQGQQLVDGLFQQQDQMRAGRALAGGNYADAMQALGAGGNIQGVRQLQGDQIAMQDRQASATKEQQAQQLSTTLQVVRTLKRARSENQDLGALVEQYRPAFAAMGTDPAQFDAIAQQISANPAFLDQIEDVIGEQARKLEIVNFGSGRGASVVDTGTGQEVNRLAPDRLPVISGGVSYDPVTGQPIFDARRPEYIEVEGSDGQPQIVAIGPNGASVAFEGQAPRNQAGVLSAAEVAAAGLAPGTVAQRTANGQISVIQAGPEAASRNRPTEAQNKDSFNANRMADSGAIISRLEGEGFDYGASQLTGGQFREGGRSYDAAAREWADSLLRLTTGAAATKDEVDSALISYFPRPGDSAAVRQQKAARRRQVEADALARGQGGAADRPRTAGDTSTQPRVRFNLTDAQQRRWQSTPRTGNRGARTNPIVINPESAAQSFNNVPRGGYFITPDGELRGPKP